MREGVLEPRVSAGPHAAAHRRDAAQVMFRVDLRASPMIELSCFPFLKLWYSFTYESTHEYLRYKKLSQT